MELFGCSHVPNAGEAVIALIAVEAGTQEQIDGLNDAQKTWIKSQAFNGSIGQVCHVPSADGTLAVVLFGWHHSASIWDFAPVVQSLPVAQYRIDSAGSMPLDLKQMAKIWGLCCYRYTRYKLDKRPYPVLIIDQLTKKSQFELNCLLAGIYHIRNWINTPAEDFGPEDLSDIIRSLATKHQAHFQEVVGDDLIDQNYPLIHAVGRASSRAPRMLCLRWGKPEHPLLALVGKGVCFDTGGIQVKPHNAMQTMKKDMGGAAHMIALAEMIMSAKLPIALNLWVAAVDNSIAGNAFLPGDVFTSRAGLTVEIGHTDAEGRLVLADLLAAASEAEPSCMIDYGTLTGAQRVALGMDLPGIFCNNPKHAHELVDGSMRIDDPLWQLPLFKPYERHIESDIADLLSQGKTPYGGAISAALFLQHFVNADTDWVHLDASCFNDTSRPGRPKGGEAMGLEALFQWVKQTFCPSYI